MIFNILLQKKFARNSGEYCEVYAQLNIKKVFATRYQLSVEEQETLKELKAFHDKEWLSSILGDENFISEARAAARDYCTYG